MFRQPVSRRPYWGLVRVLARRAEASGDEADFLAALQASERIRARQFGELVDAEAGGAISVNALRALRAGSSEDTAVVGYVVTDDPEHRPVVVSFNT